MLRSATLRRGAAALGLARERCTLPDAQTVERLVTRLVEQHSGSSGSSGSSGGASPFADLRFKAEVLSSCELEMGFAIPHRDLNTIQSTDGCAASALNPNALAKKPTPNTNTWPLAVTPSF